MVPHILIFAALESRPEDKMFPIVLCIQTICSNSTKAIYILDQPRYLNTRAGLHIMSFYIARFRLVSQGLPSCYRQNNIARDHHLSYVSFVAEEGRPTLSFVSISVVATFPACFADRVMNVY